MLLVADQLIKLFKTCGRSDGKLIIKHVVDMLIVFHGHILIAALVKGVDQIVMGILLILVDRDGLLADVDDRRIILLLIEQQQRAVNQILIEGMVIRMDRYDPGFPLGFWKKITLIEGYRLQTEGEAFLAVYIRRFGTKA